MLKVIKKSHFTVKSGVIFHSVSWQTVIAFGFKIIHLGLERWGIIVRGKRSQCESKARVDLKNKS